MKDLNPRPVPRDESPAPQRNRPRFLPTVRLPADLPEGPVAIADMANAFGVTHRTLHFYEEKRLIKAGRMGLMHIYSRPDVHRMAIITLSREVGMPIAVIQDLMADLAMAESQEEADRIFTEALEIRKRELVSSLSTVHRQMQQITHLLDRGEERAGPGNDNARPGPLSEQEMRCLELMAEGVTPARMARGLDMEPEEAQALEDGIIRKFNVNNRFQAVAKAVLYGIV